MRNREQIDPVSNGGTAAAASCGRSLAQAIIARLDFAANDAGMGRFSDWDRPMAMALLGDLDSALQELERRAASGFYDDPWLYSMEPAFEALRADPRFQRLIEDGAAHAASERATLERLRAAGEFTK